MPRRRVVENHKKGNVMKTAMKNLKPEEKELIT